MHALSKMSIERAVNDLAKATRKKYTLRLGRRVAEVLDDNCDILDYDTRASDLVRRIRERTEFAELSNLLGE
jgi:hypothetical protein